MKTPEQIETVFALIRQALPKYLAPERITLDAGAAARGMLRIRLVDLEDPRLHFFVGEWGHGVCGWVKVESTPFSNREYAAVERAVRITLKRNP